MTTHVKFPLPPGITQDDVNAPTSALADFGDALTLYVGTRELGGVYRVKEGVWTMFYPIRPEDFLQTARA